MALMKVCDPLYMNITTIVYCHPVGLSTISKYNEAKKYETQFFLVNKWITMMRARFVQMM